MTTDDMGKIIERIRKLHAKAESAREIGSLEEADAFATAVEKMLMKYKLSQATLSFEEKQAADPLGAHWLNWDSFEGVRTNKRRIGWIEKLCQAICDAHFCKVIVSRASNNFIIVGREQDRAVAEYMCVTLVRLGVALADKAYRKKRYDCWKAGRESDAHGFREAFLFGYVTRLRDRYRAMRAAEVKEHGPGVSLVVTRSLAEVDAFIKDSMATSRVNATTMKRRTSQDEGVAKGRAAADGVNLNGSGVSAGKENASSALNRGQRLLGGNGS